MDVRRSRFIRMGAKIGAGVVIGAVLAVVPMSPAGATHLTKITLSSASAPQGTASVVLNGTVDNNTDVPPSCYYGWKLSSANGTLGGAVFSNPPGAHVVAPYTLKVNTAALAPGVYNVSVNADWTAPQGCADFGNSSATASITITGRNGSFGCRAYAMRTNTDYQPANPALFPCKDDENWFAQLRPILGLGNIGAVRATTDQEPDVLNSAAPTPADYADAQAHVAGVDLTVGGVRIRTGALWSQASTNCTGANMTPRFNTNGTVATVNLNGRSFGTTSGYLKIQILNVTIEINKVTTSTTSTGTTVTRQALVIKRTTPWSTTNIRVAESTVGYKGNPCKGVF